MRDATLPFQAVLFDMDGTLVDTEPLWDAAERQLMARFGVEWTEADHAHCLGGPTIRVSRYMAGLVQEAGGEPPPLPELFREFLDTMLAETTSQPPPAHAGVTDLLAGVHTSGVPTALVSSSPRELMDAILGGLGSHWFDVTVSADDVERHKPDPLPYRTATELLGVDASWCIAVEDSPPGVASALAAGAAVVAVEDVARFEPGPRLAVLRTLEGLTVAGLAELFVPPP